MMRDEQVSVSAAARRHLDEVKQQIAHCLERELDLAAEDRRERGRRLGIEWLLQKAKVSQRT
jgi:hypothetical protein